MAEEQTSEQTDSPVVETQNSVMVTTPEAPESPSGDQSSTPVPQTTPEAVVDGVEKPKEAVLGEEVGVVSPKGGVADGEVVDESSEQPKEENKGFTVRTVETGDKVYLVKDNLRHWVKNPETLKKLGFYLGSEKTVPFTELLQWNEGEPLDLTHPEAVMPSGVTPVGDNEGVAKAPTTTQPYKVWS